MKLLLDTQMVLWAALDTSKLPVAARQQIARAEAIYVSPISLWEIGMKVSTGKLRVSMTELEAELAASDTLPLVLTWAHAIRAYDIAPYHHDPFDRLLFAQAVAEPLHLLTSDEALKAYSDLVIAV